MTRIILSQHLLQNERLEDAYIVAGAYMPSRVLSAAVTSNAGPWSRFINDDPQVSIILNFASGETIRTIEAAIFRKAHQADRFEEALATYFASALPQLAAEIMLFKHPGYALLMRPSSVLLVINEGSKRTGFYVPSPTASGHDLINDAAALEREFPGWFELR